MSGIRDVAILAAGALLLFLALFAGLRWGEAWDGSESLDPVAVGPIQVMYPAYYADSVVRVVFANYRIPNDAGGEPELLALFEAWAGAREDGTVSAVASVELDATGAMIEAAWFEPATGRLVRFAPGEGCTAQLAPGPAPEEALYIGLPLFADLGAFEREGWTPVDTPAAPVEAPYVPQTHPAANFHVVYDPAALDYFEHVFGAVDLHRAHWELGIDAGSGIVVSRARLPGDDPPGTAEAEVFLLVERFDRVAGLQAMREAVNQAELCRGGIVEWDESDQS